MWRYQAGQMTQRLIEDAAISPLRGVDISMRVDGGGHGGVVAPARTIDAIRALRRMAGQMPSDAWKMLRYVLGDGGWPWQEVPNAERGRVYNDVRHG